MHAFASIHQHKEVVDIATHRNLRFVVKNGRQVISRHELTAVPHAQVRSLTERVLHGHGTALTGEMWKQLLAWADIEVAR